MTPELDRWVGRLSIVGAGGEPPGSLVPKILERSRAERTLPIVSRNLGVPCAEEGDILARQVVAARQAAEIAERVRTLPLKGLDLAHRVYPSPGLRDMGDIDLLVPRTDLRTAVAALGDLGYRADREVGPLAAGVSSSLNSATFFRETGLPVHLHWHVSNASLPHFMYRVDLDELWAGARDGALAPHHRVVTLCEHALKHSFHELVHLADIELAARGVDADLVARTARAWGLDRAVSYAAALLRAIAGVRSPALAKVRVDDAGWADRAFVRWATRRRWDGLSALGFLSMARGVRGKVRFVREALSPRREDSEGFRTRGFGGRVGRALRMIRAGLTSRPAGPGAH